MDREGRPSMVTAIIFCGCSSHLEMMSSRSVMTVRNLHHPHGTLFVSLPSSGFVERRFTRQLMPGLRH
jgi:hypothetical protein